MKYIIVHSSESRDVQNRVNEFLEEGFKLKGKLRIHKTTIDTGYTQVMVKIPPLRVRNYGKELVK